MMASDGALSSEGGYQEFRKPPIGVVVSLVRERRRAVILSESKDPENVCSTMLIQGVLPRYCPRNRISRPQFSARSCQRGFIFSINAIFFSRRQCLSCFSRPMATCTSW